ncbi:MAG TPA: NAD(P)H-dependent oxidoreductase [Nitrososphaeraceae archaeon]|nr:NAD(P)H-dependent oxidoreductase [Nitrososphaeraceae archaeon]
MISNEKINILGVASSMRKESNSTRALKLILDIIKTNYDAEIQILDLRQTILPFLYYQEHDKKTEILTAEKMVKWADVFILATPDYHGSMSGSIKNFLDYFWSEFAGKLFGYICSSHEKGLTVMDQMRTAVRQCYGWSMPYGISINGEKDFGSTGNVTNKVLLQRIKMLARDIVIYGKLHRNQFLYDLSSHEMNTFASHYRD